MRKGAKLQQGGKVKFAVLPVLLLLASLPALAIDKYSFEDVEFHGCYDGDTCTFTIPGVPPLLGFKIKVRLRGMDAPEIKGMCPAEVKKARAARDFLAGILWRAKTITLRDSERGKYFRLVANVVADGVEVAETLIGKGLGRPYEGGKRRGWCN